MTPNEKRMYAALRDLLSVHETDSRDLPAHELEEMETAAVGYATGLVTELRPEYVASLPDLRNLQVVEAERPE